MSTEMRSAAIGRRGFLKGAFAAGSMAAVAGLAGCASPSSELAETGSPEWMPEWQQETDVVVIGYGGAGACAAIAAADAGASVKVFEKSPIADGGNTGCSSGGIHTAPFAPEDKWVEKALHGVYGTTPEETVRAMISHAQDTPNWLDEIGVDVDWKELPSANMSSRMPEGLKSGNISGYDGSEGRFLWEALSTAVEERADAIEIVLATPVIELVQNPLTSEILGVRVQPEAGEPYCVKARKGVVMALGGYENNPDMQGQFNQPGVRLFPWGTPYNTGDGINMACEVGARLWHMHGLEYSSVGFRIPSEEVNCAISSNATKGITPYSHIFVNQFGKRFMNEQKNMNHDIESKAALDFDAAANEYANLPFYMIFDQEMFDEAPLYIGTGRSGIINTYAGVQNLYEWGPDNSKGLSEGWIFKGDTLEELAANIKGTTPAGMEVGCDGEALAQTVAAYNEYAASGVDAEFSRPADRMAPLANPPYYAIELCFCAINTQGGAERDGNCQVVSTKGEPLPRLYSAGQFGSMNGYVYVFGNIFEALTTGRVAGQNVAALEAWDASSADQTA